MNNDNLYRRSEQENMSGDALQTDIIDGTAIKKISALIEAMPDMIFVMHRDGTVLEIYGSVPEKLIAPADQLIGASIRNCFDADEFERHLKLYEKCIQNNESGVIEFELTINGRKMQFLSRIKPIDDQRLLTIVQDITRLRQVDEKVHESEERYRAYVDNAPLGVFVANKEGRYLEVNEEACRITGYAREELLARNFIDLIDPESIVSAEAHFAKLQAEGRSSGEIAFRTKTGEKRWWHVVGAKLSENRFLGFTEDTTARKQAELALSQSEARFKQVIELIGEGIGVVDSNEVFQFVNPAAEKIFEVENSGLSGRSLREFVDDENYAKILTETSRRKLKERTSYELKIHTGKGNEKYIFVTATPMLDSYEHIKGTFGVFFDITERKHAEETIIRNEKHFHLLLDLHRVAEGAVEEVLNYSLEAGLQATQSEFAFLGSVNPDESILSINKWSKGVMSQCAVPVKSHDFHVADIRLLGDAIRKRQPVIVNDYERSSEIKNGYPEGHVAVRRFLSVPVMSGNRIVAVGAVANKDSDYKDADIIAFSSLLHEMWNILELKTREDELRKLSRAMEQSPAAVVITNTNGDIEYINPKYSEVTGYTMEEAIGKNPRMLNSGKQSDEFYKDLWDTITSGKEWKGEILNKKKSGDLFWESVSISPITGQDGEITHYLAVKEDITEKKKVEQELFSAKEKAEESNRLKTAFINNISHEVRTPLNGILGFGEFMMDENLSRADKLEYYKIVKQSSDRLQQTINDIMDLSELKAGTIKPNKSDLYVAGIVSNLCDQTKRACAKKNVLVSMEIPAEFENLVLQTDEELFTKIVSHLLSNAEKFTTTGRITMGYEVKNEWVEFFVKDTGKGIAADKIAVIFEPFMQEDTSNTRGYEGSGTGLSIVKGMLQLLGGKLWVETQKGKGSTFFFKLPLIAGKHKQEPVIEITTPTDQKKVAGNRLILIAEDDESNAQLMQVVMQKDGFSTLHAYNGAEAVDLCSKYPEISIVLMDIKMPVMNGMEATAAIKKIRPELPVIALTAHAQTGDRHRMLLAGCDEYLAKPVNLNELKSMVIKMIK